MRKESKAYIESERASERAVVAVAVAAGGREREQGDGRGREGERAVVRTPRRRAGS